MHRRASAGNRASMERGMLVNELKARVAREEYEVDCRAVAEALLVRHARCSHPFSVTTPSGPVKVTPAGPRFTRPTANPDSSSPPDASSS